MKRMLQLKARLTGSFSPKELAHMAHDWASASTVPSRTGAATSEAVARQRARVKDGRAIVSRGTRAGRARPTAHIRNTSRWRTSPGRRDGGPGTLRGVPGEPRP